MGLFSSGSAEATEPFKASRGDLLLFHKENYVRLVKKLSDEGFGLLDQGDTTAFPRCYDVARTFVGASMMAADHVMGGHGSVAFNIGGGFHHALPDRAAGFCIFNDVGVAISHLKKRYGVRKLLYVDIDAHHGDGVMYSYYSDAGVLDIDFHESGKFLFPGTGFVHEVGDKDGRWHKVNVPLLPHTSDTAFLRLFREIVEPLAKSYKPEVILLQCGVDAHFGDQLAHLSLTTQAYIEVAKIMMKLAEQLCHGRLVLFGGGGYNTAAVSKCWTLMVSTLSGQRLAEPIPITWLDEFEKFEHLRPSHNLEDEPTTPNAETDHAEKEALEILSQIKDRIFPNFSF